MTFVHGQQVRLRPVEDSDTELLFAWMNDPEVAWWMDYERPFSRSDIADDIASSRAEGIPFVVEVGGTAVGRCGLNRIRRRDQAASAYMFIGDPAYRGRGLGKDAMMALLNYAFQFCGFRLVDLWVLAENKAAVATYTSCGFREDGRLRDRSWKYDRWMDHIWMSVVREEFQTALTDYPLPDPSEWGG